MKSIFCLLLLLSSAIGYAQEEENKHIETDRPNEAEVPYLVPKKYIQIETGIRRERAESYLKTELHPSFLAKFGVSDRLELRMATKYITEAVDAPAFRKRQSGIPPVELGGKVALLKEHKWIPRTALLAETGIPSFATGPFKANHLSPTFRLLMENNLTSALSLTYNVGVS